MRLWSLLVCAVVAQAGQPGVPPDVSVALHCEVVATPGVVARAKQLAKEVFDSIGVNMAWCGGRPTHEPGILIKVDLLAGPDEHSNELGNTTPFAKTHSITINYDAVRRSAGTSRQLEPVILGHVMVHEITHILQGVNRHSETGMMKARWTPEDYCDMQWKPLEFTPEDIILIRLGLVVLREQEFR